MTDLMVLDTYVYTMCPARSGIPTEYRGGGRRDRDGDSACAVGIAAGCGGRGVCSRTYLIWLEPTPW